MPHEVDTVALFARCESAGVVGSGTYDILRSLGAWVHRHDAEALAHRAEETPATRIVGVLTGSSDASGARERPSAVTVQWPGEQHLTDDLDPARNPVPRRFGVFAVARVNKVLRCIAILRVLQLRDVLKGASR